jgi:formylglycine-generating enzyme required for sulfatase activity
MPDELFPRFARVPAGSFSMGADDGDEDERPAHTAYVDAVSLSVSPITHQQYAAFVRATGHPPPAVRDLPLVATSETEAMFRELSDPYVWRAGAPPPDRLRHPVTLIRFHDALAYCNWLSTQLAVGVRLPTEAEWERAARGGVNGRRFPWGDDIDSSRANFLAAPELKRARGTSPVGGFAANAFGLHDMIGNVWEWIADWYAPDTYRLGERRNPRGPESGTLRVVRGGSWVTHDVNQLRCSHRQKVPPDTYAYSIGFRVAYPSGPDV